ncbi:MAG: hypothetical protein LKJ47_02550 [Bifidobacteriaceae bacterium]|jgi:hypothetical protein|nr:hypothetical protein [Bifidobacteriaceae bacterium]
MNEEDLNSDDTKDESAAEVVDDLYEDSDGSGNSDDEWEDDSLLLNVVYWTLGATSLGTVYSLVRHQWLTILFSLGVGAVFGLCAGLWKKYQKRKMVQWRNSHQSKGLSHE